MLDHVFHCNVRRNIHFIVFAVLIMRYRYRDALLTSEMTGLDEKKTRLIFSHWDSNSCIRLPLCSICTWTACYINGIKRYRKYMAYFPSISNGNFQRITFLLSLLFIGICLNWSHYALPHSDVHLFIYAVSYYAVGISSYILPDGGTIGGW